MGGRRRLLAGILGVTVAVALGGGCRPSPPPSRVPTVEEASPERVVVNYAPQQLRVLPAATEASAGSYLLLGSERPGLPAVFRPLGVSTRKAPVGYISRAGELAWVHDHVVEAAPADAALPLNQAVFRVYDTDSKVATPAKVTLPAPCLQTRPALLQSDGRELYALLRCSPQDAALVLRLSAKNELVSARVVPGAGDAELLFHLHQGEVDYLLAGQRVLRVDSSGVKSAAVEVGPSSAGAEARDLVYVGSTLIFVDGGAGKLTGLDGESLERRFERRFYTSAARPITRLRAVASRPELLTVVVAEHAASTTQGPTELVAVALPLSGKSSGYPTRIQLGGGPPKSDHELTPVADSDGGGAILVRTHAGNSGPLVALTQLHL